MCERFNQIFKFCDCGLVKIDLRLQLLHNLGELVPHLHREGVQLERIVQRDGGDARGLVNRPRLARSGPATFRTNFENISKS